MKNLVWAIALLAVGILSGWLLQRCNDEIKGWGCGRVERDTVVVIDTITIDRPVVKDSFIVKTVTRFLRLADTVCVTFQDTVTVHDSILVEVPITQVIYAGDDYRAWVSGYEPKLDSIEIYRRETTIRPRTKRWSVGLQAGYGMTPKGFAPYVGAGVSYKLPP